LQLIQEETDCVISSYRLVCQRTVVLVPARMWRSVYSINESRCTRV